MRKNRFPDNRGRMARAQLCPQAKETESSRGGVESNRKRTRPSPHVA
jgi:hypothetical protein